MPDMIALGIGFLDKLPGTLKDDMNLPVYIAEPLVVLSLRLLFEQQTWSMMKVYMVRSIHIAPNRSVLGRVFEAALPLVLMETFGGEPTPLKEAFDCSSKLGSRRVTLASLKRVADELEICPVSWNQGSSDCLCQRAKTPTHVLEFFDNPNGTIFLFSDNHMHPSLLWFFQDKDTKDLILCLKVTQNLMMGIWKAAINSITPQFFYMMVVGIILCDLFLYPYFDVYRSRFGMRECLTRLS